MQKTTITLHDEEFGLVPIPRHELDPLGLKILDTYGHDTEQFRVAWLRLLLHCCTHPTLTGDELAMRIASKAAHLSDDDLLDSAQACIDISAEYRKQRIHLC